jgi:hypothetical protein
MLNDGSEETVTALEQGWASISPDGSRGMSAPFGQLMQSDDSAWRHSYTIRKKSYREGGWFGYLNASCQALFASVFLIVVPSIEATVWTISS